MHPRDFIIIPIIPYPINFIFSDLSYPDFNCYKVWSLRVREEYCWHYFAQPISMTRGAYNICEALHQSCGVSLYDLKNKESPLYRRRIIALINKVHAYRNRIFHSLTTQCHHYTLINGEWQHYWEYHMRFSDSQWGGIHCSDGRYLTIMVSDLCSKDECYINNFDNYDHYVRGESH